MSEEEKIFKGRMFAPGHPELRAIKMRSHLLSQEYSQTREDETERRARLVKEMFLEFGEGSFVQGPVFLHYGKHTKVGKRVFFNYNLTIQDDAPVTIGDDCNFGPNFTVVTPVHPLLPDERYLMYNEEGEPKHMCYAKPVTIGRDCWFGANVVVCPGVTVGDGCTIGAGSVVTHDIPAGSVAVGVPCRVLRRVSEEDSMVNYPDIAAGCRPIDSAGLARLRG